MDTMDILEHPAPPPAKEKYETECQERGDIPRQFDTPRNLHLEIVVNDDKALVHCGPVEHVGGPRENRAVTFRANKDCKLIFTNDTVFGVKEEMLVAHVAKTLFIDEERIKSDNWFKAHEHTYTFCSVDPLNGKEIQRDFHSPPKIEVP